MGTFEFPRQSQRGEALPMKKVFHYMLSYLDNVGFDLNQQRFPKYIVVRNILFSILNRIVHFTTVIQWLSLWFLIVFTHN